MRALVRAAEGRLRGLAPGALLTLALACGGEAATEPPADPLSFDRDALVVGPGLEGTILVQNRGPEALGPLTLESTDLNSEAGRKLAGSSIVFRPDRFELAPGEAVSVRITMTSSLNPLHGPYRGRVVARLANGSHQGPSITVPEAAELPAALTLEVPSDSARQGDPVPLEWQVHDRKGRLLHDAVPGVSIEPSSAGIIVESDRFVPYEPGPVRLVARAGEAVDTVEIEVHARDIQGAFTDVGRGVIRDRFIFESATLGHAAYTSTWKVPPDGLDGNFLFVWDVSNPGAPVLVDSIASPGKVMYDVAVDSARGLALLAHQGVDDPEEALTVLDLADPVHPRILADRVPGFPDGARNVSFTGELAWVTLESETQGGVAVVDLADPARPRVVSVHPAGESYVEDATVRDGVGFWAHWTRGLQVFDAGVGLRAGSPRQPQLLGSLDDLGGETHQVVFWPDREIAFVLERDFRAPGYIRVVDLRDLRNPRVTATIRLPLQPPHKAVLDESAGILYVAWTGQGVRAYDVSGELAGELTRQGREVASSNYNGGGPTCATDSQGVELPSCAMGLSIRPPLVFVADLWDGLVVLRLER